MLLLQVDAHANPFSLCLESDAVQAPLKRLDLCFLMCGNVCLWVFIALRISHLLGMTAALSVSVFFDTHPSADFRDAFKID